MNTRTRWFILAVTVGLACQQGVAGTILGAEGRKCFPPTLTTSATNGNLSVYGDFIENISRVTTTAPGVTVNIISKENGLQNNAPGQFTGKGRVVLRINTNNATPGNRTISLINDGVLGAGADVFTLPITVVSLPTVTSVNVPTPTDPFQDITVTLNGSGLQEAVDPATGVIATDNLIPLITVGGTASVSSVRVLSSTATSLQAKIFFTALVQDATVDLSFRSSSQCVPLGVANVAGIKQRVHVKSSNVRNYVKSFTFPQGSTFAVNGVATIDINLLFPAPSGTRQAGGGVSFDNSTVSFKLVPATSFEAVANGTPINATGFTVVRANTGEDIIPITFKIKDCGGGQAGQANAVKIQTWMHSTNTNLPPNFVETTFRVQCTQ